MPDAADVLRTLRSSQQRLATLVDGLGEVDLERPSYDSGWSIADVLSHLGSQAEIFLRFVDSGLDGTEAPSNDSFGPIWDVWNGKAPGDKAADSLAADRALLDRLEALSDDELAHFELRLFGMQVDAAVLLGMRLGEHALHSWDVAVALDDDAVLAPDATDVIVDGLGAVASRAGIPDSDPLSVNIVATAPARRFILDTAGVSLEPGEGDEGLPVLELSSEALIRLVYGRLDDLHLGAPAPNLRGIELARVRAVFPGF